jgi:uncharacterized protein involved in type VI secretion and phage assembly
MGGPDFPVAVGVLYSARKDSYVEDVREHQDAIRSRERGDLKQLLHSGNTWTVG